MVSCDVVFTSWRIAGLGCSSGPYHDLFSSNCVVCSTTANLFTDCALFSNKSRRSWCTGLDGRTDGTESNVHDEFDGTAS